MDTLGTFVTIVCHDAGKSITAQPIVLDPKDSLRAQKVRIQLNSTGQVEHDATVVVAVHRVGLEGAAIVALSRFQTVPLETRRKGPGTARSLHE
jgi:hypothetical protein